jgi:hypothetical protein
MGEVVTYRGGTDTLVPEYPEELLGNRWRSPAGTVLTEDQCLLKPVLTEELFAES